MPRRRNSEQALTPLELEIMNVLWTTGPASVQTVQEKLAGRSLAYTTVQTMLNVLHRKGKVKVKRREGERAFLYRPVLSRQKAITQAVGDVLDRFFGGSADSLVLSLVETRKLTPEKLSQIQKLLQRSREEKHGND